MLSVEEFGLSIKQKYPQYKDIDSKELGLKVLEKHPQYRDRVQTGEESSGGYLEGAKQDLKEGWEGIKKDWNEGMNKIEEIKASDQSYPSKVWQTGNQALRTEIFDPAWSAISTGVKAVIPNSIEEPIKEKLGMAFQGVGELGSKIPGVSTLADKYVGWENANPEAAGNVRATGQAVQSALDAYMFMKGAEKTGEVVKSGVDKVKNVASNVKTVAGEVKSGIEGKLAERKTPEFMDKKVTNELKKIEGNYAQMRKMGEYSSDSLEGTRDRIVKSKVLAATNPIDETGTIRTKLPGGAVDQYREATIGSREGIVRENLVKEGKMVNLSNVEQALTDSVHKSGLVGKDLETALNNVKKEIAGYALSADEGGNIPLSAVHDAKVGTARMVNWQTPMEKAAYRKAIAGGLKRVVEKYSSLPIEKWNAELKKFYSDLDYLEALDGKKVQGGKLGKYFSQISGNMIGATAGAAVGGPVGSAVGTIAGGEAGGFIKGKMMQNAFGKAEGIIPPKSTILDEAVNSAKGGVEVAKPTGTVISRKAQIIDPDLIKKKFNDYNPANHEKYSAMAKEEYAKALKENPNPVVKMTLGGSGSGKSEVVIKKIAKDFDGVILDGTGANYDSFVNKINQAINAGKQVEVHASLPNVENAWKFVEKRYLRSGRNVPLPEFVKIHEGAIDTLQKLAKDHPEVKVVLYDTRNLDKIRVYRNNGALQNVLKGVGLDREALLQKLKAKTAKGQVLSDVDKNITNITNQINEGGITYDVMKNKSLGGEDLRSVSIYPERTVTFNGGLNEDKVLEFIENNLDLLTQKNHAFGGWYDTKGKKLYLDVTTVVKDMKKAVELGKKYNQKAIFDLKTFKEIDTGGTGERISGLPLIGERVKNIKIIND